jgi:hypothetical protein
MPEPTTSLQSWWQDIWFSFLLPDLVPPVDLFESMGSWLYVGTKRRAKRSTNS